MFIKKLLLYEYEIIVRISSGMTVLATAVKANFLA
jgi:hypothetical protein